METPTPTEVSLRIQSLLEEYRALYSLVLLRLTSLDRRMPVAGVTLATFLGTVVVLPPDAQMVVFVGLPLVLIWLVRTTINHARSFEDCLRRIEQIERTVNTLLEEETLCFQSRHPSRGGHVGGRTSTETVAAVLCTSLTLLLACFYLFVHSDAATARNILLYGVLLLAITAYLLWTVFRLRRYRYTA